MQTVIRTIIYYFTVVFVFRCMGKRQIGELQPSELVLAIMVSDLATTPVHDAATPIYMGILPIIVLMIIEVLLAYISQKSVVFRRIVTGKPSIIINHGKIDVKMLKKLRFNIDDMFEVLRSSGYMSVGEVEYAILETNGQLSVIPKTENTPLTLKILNGNYEKASLPRSVIKDGKINKENLALLGLDENWLKKELERRNIKTHKEVFLFTTDGKESFVQKNELN